MPSLAKPIYESLETGRVTIQDREVVAPEARMAFKVETITSLASMLILEHEWDDLARRAGTYSIFSTFHWNLIWARRFARHQPLSIITVRRKGRLIGLAPLVVSRTKIAGIERSALQFMGSPLNDYNEFLLAEDKEQVLGLIWDRILSSRADWQTIALDEIPESSATLVLTPQILKKHPVFASTVFCNDCFAQDMASFDPVELNRYMKKKDVNRHINNLKKQGTLSFGRIRDKKTAKMAMATLIDQHIKIWEKKGVASSFLDQEHRQFAHDLLETYFDDGNFAIWQLKHNDDVLAILQGFIHDTTLFGYFKSYNLDFAKRGPGMIATKFLMEQAEKEGITRIDFSRGREPYKLKLAKEQRKNRGIVVSKDPATHLLTLGYHHTKERIMKDPKLHGQVQSLKNKPFFRRFF